MAKARSSQSHALYVWSFSHTPTKSNQQLTNQPNRWSVHTSHHITYSYIYILLSMLYLLYRYGTYDIWVYVIKQSLFILRMFVCEGRHFSIDTESCCLAACHLYHDMCALFAYYYHEYVWFATLYRHYYYWNIHYY